MRFSPLTAALAALALLAGCATPPSRIQAKPVTDNRFANLDCPMLISERDRRRTIRHLLEDAQGERFRADLISGALTGLTQSMVFSPEAREAKIAEVKGEIAALDGEIATKECQKRIG
jgi:type IV pilus biogenesis protein CpaD/CtpE